MLFWSPRKLQLTVWPAVLANCCNTVDIVFVTGGQRMVARWDSGGMGSLKMYIFLKNFILVVSCDDNPLTRLFDLSLSMNLEGKWLSLLTCNYCGMNKDKSRIFGWWITLYMLYTDRIYNIIIVKKKNSRIWRTETLVDK